MKVGLKIYSSDPPSYLEERQFADYMEVLAVPGQSVDKFKDYDFEYIIHAPHSLYNVNLASKKHQQYSLEATRQALTAADVLNAKIVVMHPGVVHGPEETSEENLSTFKESILQLADKRIVLENCPFYDKWNKSDDYYMGYDYASLKRYSEIFANRACLDFSHAIATSTHLKKDYKEIIKGLLKLDVRLFHICDGLLASGIDKHLPLSEGDYDLEYLRSIIKGSECKRVTLETSQVLEKQEKEYRWMKK
jgi:endonuclease IV